MNWETFIIILIVVIALFYVFYNFYKTFQFKEERCLKCIDNTIHHKKEESACKQK